MVLYFPAVMVSFDSPRYARVDDRPMFGDYWMPAGYPFVLRALHALTDQLWFTIAVQHAMGLLVGVMIYLGVRRLGCERWVACIPAAVAFLSGDHVYLEHIIMADFLLGFLAVAGLSAAVFAFVPRLRVSYLAVASTVLGMAALVRSAGIILLPVVTVCALVFSKGSFRARLPALSAAVGPGFAVIAIYAAVCDFVGGKYLGLTDMSGWNVYSRVAPFADCRRFTPPPGTEVLCEDTPPAERRGPFAYVWDKNSVAQRHFKLGPKTSDNVGAFAGAVILHQPLEYLRVVAVDLLRYIEPATGRHWPYAGQTDMTWAFGWRDLSAEEKVIAAMSRGYSGTELRVRGEMSLNFYQHLSRVSGLLLAGLLVLTGAGLWFASATLRAGILLFGLGAFGLYVLPVMTVSYDYRYGLPPLLLLVVSGTVGGVAVWRHTAVAQRMR